MNAKQLTLTLLPHVSKSVPLNDEAAWLDVSDLAKGAGFETKAAISIALADALASGTHATEADYDQRLYDALWLAQLQFTMNASHPTTFNFSFPRRQTRSQGPDEICLRLRVEYVGQTAFLGLLEDF